MLYAFICATWHALLPVGRNHSHIACPAQRSTSRTRSLRGTDGVYPVAHGDNGVQIVMFYVPGHLAGTFDLNYLEFPDSCLPL